MNYSLLKNKIYLILLTYYNDSLMPSYVTLGEKAQVSRQTASKKVKELEDWGLIEIEDNIVYVQNPLDIDREELRNYLDEEITRFDSAELYDILFGEQGNNLITKKEKANRLKMSRSNLYKDVHPVVYGIIEQGELKYIGCSEYYEERKKQHKLKRPHLNDDNFIILKDNLSENIFDIENLLIDILTPEWNKV